jgi:hypothetical protein
MTENSDDTAGSKRGRPFKPGQSGNPGGRPKLTPRALEVRAAFREASTRAVERLTELLESGDPDVVLRASKAILERAWGVPGSESEVRETDTARANDAYERQHPGVATWSNDGRPPPDVD